MADENTGVTPEGGAPSAPSDSAVVPQTTSVEANPDTETPIDSTAPPAAGDEIPENDDDLQSLPETERTPLLNQRIRLRELNKYRSGAEPIVSWVEQRGGMDYVRSDAELVDKLYSPNVEDRSKFYETLYQDEEAFDRFMTDVSMAPMVQRAVLDRIDPQELAQYVEQMGLLSPGSYIDPGTLGIPQEFRDVWRSHPPEVQESYAEMTPELRNWNLRRDAQLHNIQKADRERGIQAREQATQEQKTHVYNSVRSVIQSALAEKIPGNEEALKFILQATETALYQSPEGAALWNELEAHIESGASRAVREKLPLLVAKAKQIATQHATWLNGMESKARQFDELMRLASQDEILAYVNRMRGGMRQPGPGTTPAPANGHIPKPELAGQYDHANVLSYFPGRS